MIKKRDGVLILISLLLLVVGIYFVGGGTGQSVDDAQLTFVNTTLKIGNYQINATENAFADKWAKPGRDLVLNFTVTNTGIGNLSVINITIPDHVFRLHFGTGMSNGTSWTNGSIGKFMDMDNSSKNVWVQNLTGKSILVAGVWTGELVNTTTTNSVNHTSPTTTNVTIWFNITANANVTTEDVYTFVIATKGRVPGGTNANASHNLTIGIDGRGPRILDINVTEYIGGATFGKTLKLFSDELNGTSYLSPNLAYNITVVVNDTNFNATDGSVLIFYNTSNGRANKYDVTVNETDGVTRRIELTRQSNERLSRLGPIVFTGTIPANTLNGSNLTAFIIVVNDTFGNKVFYNSTGHSFNFSTENVAPVFQNLNVTDKNGNVLRADYSEFNGSKYLIADSAYTIRVTVVDPNINRTYARSVMIAWNSSNRGIPSIANLLGTANQHLNFTINMSTTDTTSPFMYNGTIPRGAFNHSNQSAFMIYANDSLYGNPAAVLNWSNGSGAAARGFNFTADGLAPSGIIITEPATTTIDVQSSITYKCEGSDAHSGIKSFKIILTKPTGATVEKTNDNSISYSATFTDTETNEAGTYTVKCEVTDNVGNVGYNPTEQQRSFIAQFATGAASAGGGGGGGETTVPTFDVDFSQSGITEASLSGSQGHTKSFTFDGTSRHTIRFDEVTIDSVTLTISSINPQTITLEVSETKKVDMNSDGTDDVSATLERINGGRATIRIERLSGATQVVEELREEAREVAEPTTEPTTEPPVTPVPREGAGTAWLWILLGIIAVALILYVVMRKRKK